MLARRIHVNRLVAAALTTAPRLVIAQQAEPARSAAPAHTPAPATPKRIGGLGSLGLSLGVPEHGRRGGSGSVPWGGLEFVLMPSNPYLGLGGTFFFGYGGVPNVGSNPGKTVNLAVCGEIGTPLSRRWPSLHFTGSLGGGFMNGNDTGGSGDTESETNARIFSSYGAILRVPAYSRVDPGGYTVAPYISVRREHSYWFGSRPIERSFERIWIVTSVGVTLWGVE
jgi:hypothetical protein